MNQRADIPAQPDCAQRVFEDWRKAPVEALPGVGEKSAKLLANLDVLTVGDLLHHYPRAYQDRRTLTHIADAPDDMEITLEAEIVKARNVHLRGRMNMAHLVLRDESGECTATFFGRGFLVGSTFRVGLRGFFTGQMGEYKEQRTLKNPDYEMLSGDAEDRLHTGRIVPVYRLTDKITQRMLRRWAYTALETLPDIMDEPLPKDLLQMHGFPTLGDALRKVHFPESLPEAENARARLAYEELLGLQLRVLQERAIRLHEEQGIQHIINGPHLLALGKMLPFSLTSGQEKAVSDILRDMASPRPMARLIQGDVGCGKTVVALHAIAAACDGGHQAALMAPTEILAEQHYFTLRGTLAKLGLRVELLTASMRSAKVIREEIASGRCDVVVGTHALFQENTRFQRLGLVIIDEQHRFGVLQRDVLRGKGDAPDLLQMTATPIPRSLALTLYGGLDLSVIDELPPGRLPVITRQVPEKKVADLYGYLIEQAEKGFQSYIICPLVEESDKREQTAVTTHFEELSAGPLAALRTGIVHGRMDGAQKEAVMAAFKNGEMDVLFSTTVIEVGIDVRQATTMVIENASQFGLTQLHQLRGRVGRGLEQSYCFLLGKPKTKDGKKRLEVLCSCNSGFDIAEEDLKLRGVGEFYGLKQAGLSDLRAADLLRDTRLLDLARRDAESLLAADPRLESPDHRFLLGNSPQERLYMH